MTKVEHQNATVLTDDEPRTLDDHWRAADYPAAGQVYPSATPPGITSPTVPARLPEAEPDSGSLIAAGTPQVVVSGAPVVFPGARSLPVTWHPAIGMLVATWFRTSWQELVL